MPKRLLGPLRRVVESGITRGLGVPRYKAVLILVLECHHMRRVNYRDYRGQIPKHVHCPICGAYEYGNH